MRERSNGAYLTDEYYLAPYLFDDADYFSDALLFGGVPWFDRD